LYHSISTDNTISGNTLLYFFSHKQDCLQQTLPIYYY